MMACSFGHAGIIRSLVEIHKCHIEINAVNLQGETCLMQCCFHGYFDAVKVLVETFGEQIDINLLDGVRFGFFVSFHYIYLSLSLSLSLLFPNAASTFSD
jgi:ankyrin repeat protein